ncbi:MAG: NAD(+) diphosphatase [Pseudomonadota bacterium]
MSHLDRITFARPGNGLDRAAHLRREAEALMQTPTAVAHAFFEGKVAVDLEDEKQLRPFPPAALVEMAAEKPIFLGTVDGAPRFAADLNRLDETALSTLLGDAAKFIDLRSISAELSATEAAIAATGKALLGWHATHRFCACCGAPTRVVDAGWRRLCDACGAQHFPRVDPVVIMLVLRGDNVLIGRQSGWPPGLHSLLAGFVEPGETPEEAVRREVMEEASVPVGRVRYLATQPWPYPSTLMIGCVAEALGETLAIDPEELESATWASRDEMIKALAGEHPTLGAPRLDAIARNILAAWAAGEVADFDD